MPKENINDIVTPGFRAEVSWRRTEYLCPCGTSWFPVGDGAPSYCPECDTHGLVPVNGHVQIATTSEDDGWYVTLDSAAIDRLINALTKAGAQAFPGWKPDWEETPHPS